MLYFVKENHVHRYPVPKQCRTRYDHEILRDTIPTAQMSVSTACTPGRAKRATCCNLKSQYLPPRQAGRGSLAGRRSGRL